MKKALYLIPIIILSVLLYIVPYSITYAATATTVQDPYSGIDGMSEYGTTYKYHYHLSFMSGTTAVDYYYHSNSKLVVTTSTGNLQVYSTCDNGVTHEVYQIIKTSNNVNRLVMYPASSVDTNAFITNTTAPTTYSWTEMVAFPQFDALKHYVTTDTKNVSKDNAIMHYTYKLPALDNNYIPLFQDNPIDNGSWGRLNDTNGVIQNWSQTYNASDKTIDGSFDLQYGKMYDLGTSAMYIALTYPTANGAGIIERYNDVQVVNLITNSISVINPTIGYKTSTPFLKITVLYNVPIGTPKDLIEFKTTSETIPDKYSGILDNFNVETNSYNPDTGTGTAIIVAHDVWKSGVHNIEITLGSKSTTYSFEKLNGIVDQNADGKDDRTGEPIIIDDGNGGSTGTWNSDTSGTNNWISDQPINMFNPPQRSDSKYVDGWVGDLNYGFDSLMFYLLLPFRMIYEALRVLLIYVTKLFDLLGTAENSLKVLFGYIPTEIQNIIWFTFITSIILGFVRRK